MKFLCLENKHEVVATIIFTWIDGNQILNQMHPSHCKIYTVWFCKRTLTILLRSQPTSMVRAVLAKQKVLSRLR